MAKVAVRRLEGNTLVMDERQRMFSCAMLQMKLISIVKYDCKINVALVSHHLDLLMQL